jgi:hypothetical protein
MMAARFRRWPISATFRAPGVPPRERHPFDPNETAAGRRTPIVPRTDRENRLDRPAALFRQQVVSVSASGGLPDAPNRRNTGDALCL